VEAITLRTHAANQARLVGVFFNFLSEASHKYIHRAWGDIRIFPNDIKQLVPSTHHMGMSSHIVEQPELRERAREKYMPRRIQVKNKSAKRAGPAPFRN
jgi:hypothetical protein